MMNSELKTLINIPWADNENAWKGKSRVTTESEAYARVPLIFRALRMRCNSLLRVPVKVMEGESEVESYVYEDSLKLRDLLWLSEAALLLKGAAYNLRLQNRFGFAKGLQWLNPFTVYTQYQNGELFFYQQLFTGERFPARGYWTMDDFLYLREFSPTTDIDAGVSATQVALGSAQISNNVTQFLSDFFGADALPVTLVVMPTGTKDPERERVENWFIRRLKGLMGKSTPRVLGVTKDVKLEKLTPELKTFEFEKIDVHAQDAIAHAFDIPRSVLLGTGANRAETEAHYRSFLDTTVIPRCRYYESMLNPLLEEAAGQHITFTPEEMPEYQVEETDRATSLKTLTDAGVPLLAALDILGYDLTDETRKIIEKSEKERPKFPVQSSITPPTNGKREPVLREET